MSEHGHDHWDISAPSRHAAPPPSGDYRERRKQNRIKTLRWVLIVAAAIAGACYAILR
jgi:hypothetical protein